MLFTVLSKTLADVTNYVAFFNYNGYLLRFDWGMESRYTFKAEDVRKTVVDFIAANPEEIRRACGTRYSEAELNHFIDELLKQGFKVRKDLSSR